MNDTHAASSHLQQQLSQSASGSQPRLRMASSALRVVYSFEEDGEDEMNNTDAATIVGDDDDGDEANSNANGLASAGTVLTRSESLVDGFQPVVPAIVPHGQVQQNPRPRRGAAWNDNEPDSTLPCPEEELPTFALRPVPYGDEIKCRILRKKSIARGGRNYPSYELYIEDGDRVVFFLSARKTNYVSQSSHYVISTERLDRWTKEATVAHVRSNFIGTAFSIYDNADFSSKLKFGTHEEFAAVLYEPNILGVKGPRKMTAILPAMGENGKRAPMHPQNEKETLLFRSKRDIDPDVHVMHNKTPQWNAETESFVLNFNTRVTMASVKNFQIVHDHDLDYIIMQFGRIASDKFTLDYKYPMTAVQAFGIALTSFDAKLACE